MLGKVPSPCLGSFFELSGRPRFFLLAASPIALFRGLIAKEVLMLVSGAGPGAIMGAIAARPPNTPPVADSAFAFPPTGSLATGVLCGGMTSPRAIAAAFRASTSALEGRPRFFGCVAAGLENERGEPFEDGLGWIRIIVSAPD